uniref:Monoacylglycerol lipase ABHD12 n=2 Tax=Lygus hesperus TaxID=30085 RepID=A0A0A9XHW2_LYGHE
MELEILYKGIAVYCYALIAFTVAFTSFLIAIGTFISVLLILFLLYVVIPIVFKYTPSLQKGLLYLSSVYIPVDFKNPNKLIPASRNFYIKTNESITLGVWQILPISLVAPSILTPPADYEKFLSNGNPVFIYMHGNSGNRGTGHRIDLYKVLQKNNYHVIAFDYRNYGDSGQAELSEEGTVNDARAIYEWTREKVKGKGPIFFWGHSLGTGISSHLLDDLEMNKTSVVTGLVLESPFNNLKEEIKSYPLAQIWSFLPWFDYFFTSPMYENGLQYESDKHLTRIKTPILILHAEDDVVIPIQLSKKLYERILTSRDSNTVEFKTFPYERHYGHKFIVKDKELPAVLAAFVERSKKQMSSS